jgi:hypothetical protein
MSAPTSAKVPTPAVGEAAVLSPSKRAADPNAPPPPKKKPNNGWTREIETLMAEWADKAVCYRWMHEKTERIFYRADMSFMFPVIILSTITGAGNFALDSVLTDPEHKKYAQLGLGGLSILTGIISTIGNRLGYGGRSEAHKGAAVQWGKFQRLIAIELALHPNERIDCMSFLKMCRAELDRLIEQSPTIPESVIKACKVEFSKYPAVRKPEIIGDIQKTNVFVNTEERAKQLARDAAMLIHQKKGVLKQIVLDDLEPRIHRILEASSLPAIKEELREEARNTATAVATAATKEAVARVVAPKADAVAAAGTNTTTAVKSTASVAAIQQARAKELQKVVSSGVVSSIRAKLNRVNEETGGPAPAGVGMLFADLADVAGIGTKISHATPEIESEDEDDDVESGAPLVPTQIVSDLGVTLATTDGKTAKAPVRTPEKK